MRADYDILIIGGYVDTRAANLLTPSGNGVTLIAVVLSKTAVFCA